jgi:hypothetical protein
MMALRADFEENNLWDKLALALMEGVPGEYLPNYYIDKVRGYLVRHHTSVSWGIRCTDLNGQVWGLLYLQPGDNPEMTVDTRTINMRVQKGDLAVTRRSRYNRDPVI